LVYAGKNKVRYFLNTPRISPYITKYTTQQAWGEMRNTNTILVRKSEGKKLLGRPRDRRIILKLILKKQGIDWAHLA
jgi:hypothetical protein